MKISRRGFSTVEVLVVIAVIGVLTTIGVVSYNRYRLDARDAQRESQLTTVADALERYFQNNGEYPSCASMTQDPNVIVANILPGVDPNLFVSPSSGLTNSILCGTTNDSNNFGYVGDGSSTCQTGTACLSYQLQYKRESDGVIVSIDSQNSADITTSGAITLNAIPTPSCSVGFTNLSTSWNNVNGAATYTVQRDTSNTFLSTSSNFAEVTTSSNSATLGGLSPNTTYFTRVRGNAQDGKYTFWSNVQAQSTLNSSITLSATAATFSINLSWTADACAYQYTVQRATDSGFTQNLVETNYASGTTTATQSSLAGSTTYYFRIRMITAASGGYTSPWSSVVSAVPLSAPPSAPVMSYVSTGVFEVSNTVAGATYSASLVSGSGSASQSTVNGKIRFSLSTNPARFSVTAAWSAGGSPSSADYMERKPFSYTPYTCGTCCGSPYGCWKSCGCECGGGGCGCYGNSGQSWGQCGCPGTMCWYNWGTCQDCSSCCSGGNLIDETGNGYTNGGSEWYKLY